ncbi:dihydrofolate reductase [Paenibacillus sp. y28]|uniref:dihydrofolate reductase n=1 Tax=Paenibacillus sp. y28 TaxID=3129110 RepID=UPI003016FC07
MSLSLIWAMGSNRVIGINNAMPWRLPSDMQHFIRTTRGHTVLMGRKTFESIGSKPLPKRHNVVLTRDESFQAPEGVTVLHSLDEGLALAANEDVICMGGADIYTKLLPQADRLYMTVIHHDFEGDAFFPEIDMAEWRLVSEAEGVVDEENVYPHTFYVYDRIRD